MNFRPIHLNILSRFGKVFISAGALGVAAGAILATQESRSIDEVIVGKKNGSEQDIAGIERLHQQDASATLSDKADELAKLWDSDAVRIQPGRPAEVGKAVIYANDKRWEASKGKQKTLCGHMEIQDLQIAGDWAFEWAYFSYKENTAEGKVSTSQGKVLRVLHRQVDGSWKFARVMNFTEKLPSAAPVSHPCE
jgi:ketosteroid isomerase-like protein